MDIPKSKKFNMYTTTMAVVDENDTVWAGDTAYENVVLKVKAKMVKITEKDQLNKSTKSATAKKNQEIN